ncbi:diacylglycerol/polyprenol kinase family protein, partial [Gordonibacter pamelaeae]
MQDVVGMGLSLVYVLAVLAASSLLARHGMGEEGTRKLVHVALGGWWVVAALFFTSPWWAAALPAAFIVVNALAWRKQKLAFMARGEGEDTPGTVYYAVSLTLIALFSFGLGAPYVGALGVFCMAFGDGLAAVLGRRFGRRPLPGAGGGKSLAGSAAMLGVSFVSCAGVLLAAAAVDWEGAVPTFAPGAGLA